MKAKAKRVLYLLYFFVGSNCTLFVGTEGTKQF
jgi:hypothetical protein